MPGSRPSSRAARASRSRPSGPTACCRSPGSAAWAGGVELDWIDLGGRGLPAGHRRRGPGRPPRQGRRHVRRHGDPGRACATSSRHGASRTGGRSSGRSRHGARGSAAPRGWTADAAALAEADARRGDEPARRPLVLARRRARDRGAPPLPGLPRVRPGAPDRARPQPGVPGGARDVRAVRRRGLRRAVHELRRAGRQPAARAPARSARLGLRRPPPRGVRPGGAALRGSPALLRGCGQALPRPPVGRSGRPGAARLRPAPAAPPRAARARAGSRAHGARRAPLDRRDAGRQRRPAPLPVDDLLAHRPRRARAAVPRRGLHARRAARRRRRSHRQRDRARRGRPPARLAAARRRRVRSAAPRAARPRRGGERLRLTAHGLRLRRARGRDAVADPLRRRLARVLLQRRPVPLRAALERRAARVRPGEDAAARRGRCGRRGAAERHDVRRPGSRPTSTSSPSRRSRSPRGGSTTSRPSPRTSPGCVEAYGGDREAIATFEDVHLGYVSVRP